MSMRKSGSIHKTPTKSKAARVNIRDLVDRDDGKPSGKNLMKGLEDNVRKVLAAKKKEYDRVSFELKKKTKELENLQLELQDVKRDGEALGMSEEPDASKRLQPVKAISNRPVYSKNTNLSEKVQELEERKVATQQVMVTGEVYEFMRKRLMTEIVDEKKRNWSLAEKLNSETIRNTELKRQHISVGESLGKAMAQLAQLRKDVEHELFLWRSEIKDRETWATEKEKFESFLEAQLNRQRELTEQMELEAKEVPTEGPDPVASRRVGTAFLETEDQEAKYEAVFRRIGVDPEELSVEKVIDACKQQDEVRRELVRKRAAEEQRVSYLTSQLDNAQRTLEAALADRERTTNRLLADTEKELSEVEIKLEADRSEFQFMQQSLQPVRIGLQHLAKKVLRIDVDLRDASEITAVMNQLQRHMAQVMEDAKNTSPDATGKRAPPAPPVTSAGPSSTEVKPSLHPSYIAPTDEAPGWLISEHNVRVRTQSDATGVGGDEDYSSDSDTDVLDRSELKKVAHTITHTASKKARKTRAQEF